MIRPARFGDIPDIVALMRRAHERSNYRDICVLDDKEARRTLMQAIQRHGGEHEGATLVMVAEKDDRLVGFTVGVLQRFYFVSDRLEATDLWLYATRRAGKRLFDGLVQSIEDWARPNPKVAVIRMGATDFIQDHRLTARLYGRRGYRTVGGVFEMRIER